MKKYYCNKECTLVAELPNNQSVIKIIETEYDYNEGQGVDYPVITLIVDNKYITDKPLNFDELYLIKEQEIDKKLNDYKQDNLTKLRNEKQELENQINTITKKLKKYISMDEFIDIIEGNIKYIITDYKVYNDYYYPKIYKAEELKSDRELKAVIYRKSPKENQIYLAIGQYSDFSGSSYKMKVLKNDNDLYLFLENYIKEFYNKFKKLNHNHIKLCDEYNITSDIIEQERKRIKEEDRECILKRLNEQKEEVIKIEKQLNEY